MKTYVFVGTSLDGFIARTNGDFKWLIPFQNEDVHKNYNEFIAGIDAIVIGRGTYEVVLAFPTWPYDKKLFLLSSSIKQVPDSLKEKVTILSMSPHEVLVHLASLGYSNVYVDGGQVIQSFLREDCIDEMIITKVPILIGTGIPLFGHLDNDIQFMHLRTDTYSNGLVKSHYRRKRD